MSFKRALLKATYEFAKVIGITCLGILGMSLIGIVVVGIPILLFRISVWLMALYFLILLIFIHACELYRNASKKDDC
ncbi:hypothetical protein ABW03_19370 [Bacillus altitudinis]|nr:hypothetical protein ABW03_19370 [Bacillus altitudinis]